MREHLTQRQSEILAYVTERWREGVPATVREIGAEFGINSPNGVTCHLEALRKKGAVEWDEGMSRTLRPVGLPSYDELLEFVESVAAGGSVGSLRSRALELVGEPEEK